MTETDPDRPERDLLEAGTTGSRRKEVGAPITPDERESLNIPPNAPEAPEAPASARDGTPTADLGVSPADRDGTPPQADETAAVAAGATGTGTGTTATGAVRTGGGTTGPGESSAGTTDPDQTSKESMRRDIENDRRELGDTVEALVHKTDVKGRVQETATHMGEDIRRMGAATAGTATEMVGRVKEAAPEVVGRVKEITPVELKDAAEKVRTEAGKRPVVAAAAMAALTLIVFRVLRRGRRK
ncbi:DUF3618 domain-containing protein [Streptosporangium sp. CA-135522]|uniref:DUF3618 domain-containing protein n=1 Tax=Streptosporangium sp. CA-135522 TaxID=3240072 RepID=UPI003D8D20B2